MEKNEEETISREATAISKSRSNPSGEPPDCNTIVHHARHPLSSSSSMHVRFVSDCKIGADGTAQRNPSNVSSLATLHSYTASHYSIPPAITPRNGRKTTLLEHSKTEYTFVVGLGMTMAFIAGYSNAVCLSGNIHVADNLAVRQSVAGVTGVYTTTAINLAQGNWESYRLNVFTILSVIAGACISSLFNPYPIPFTLCPRYGISLLIGGFFTTLGGLHWLHNDQREFYFTAMGNGIMNGISSMYTSNLIRTTHLTGTTTDIGLFVGQYLCGNHVNLWKLYILAGLAVSFWIGSLAGYYSSVYEREQSLIMNSVFFYVFGTSIIGYNYWSHPEMTWCDAIFGVGFCTSSDFHDDDHHRSEYHHGCIETRCCGNGVWCCKPVATKAGKEEEEEESHQQGPMVERDEEPTEGKEVNLDGVSSNNNNNNTIDVEDNGRLLTSHDEITVRGNYLVSKEDLLQLFQKLDENGDGYVDPQELAMELLEEERHRRSERHDAHHHHHHHEGGISASSSDHHHHHHHPSNGSVRSCALKSIDSLRIASIREIESTGHHVRR